MKKLVASLLAVLAGFAIMGCASTGTASKDGDSAELADFGVDYENYSIQLVEGEKGSINLYNSTVNYKDNLYKALNFTGKTGADKSGNHYFGIQMNDGTAPEGLTNKFINCGKTVSFYVLGDGNAYNIDIGWVENGSYLKWVYRFETKKDKITKVKIPLSSFMSCSNVKDIDMSKINQIHFSYLWEEGENGKRSYPKQNYNFGISIFDFNFK